MNDFQIYNKKYSKLSLHKNDRKNIKMKNIPPMLKEIFNSNSNSIENHSHYGNYNQNSKKYFIDENMNIKNSKSNINSQNLSSLINGISKNKPHNKDSSLNIQKNILSKKKVEKFLYNSKKEENNYNSKENSNNDNYYKTNVILNRMNNLKLNIITKKPNLNFINIKKNNISYNSNINIKKSTSKSKSKNKKENKSYNSKINNNINKIIFDKYIKLYKIGEKEIRKKSKSKSLNIGQRESPNYIINKYSTEMNENNNNNHKMSLSNLITNIQYKGLNKKNKSCNLLMSNLNKQKKAHNSKRRSNIIITKIEQNNNSKIKNNNINNIENINDKKYLTQNHIMYFDKKYSGIKKEKKMKKRNKEKQLSFNNLKNDYIDKANIINGSTSNYFNTKNIDYKNKDKENVIYDYKSNNILKNDNKNNINKNSKLNTLNNENNFKILNERLKTEYNNKSLRNEDEINEKSLSFNEDDGVQFLYPEIYIKDDEYYFKNGNKKREKELDETESPLKMDTDKITNENSGVLSYDQVKDIICYNDMNNIDKNFDFIFKKNEREIYNMNYKKKYLNFFFDKNTNHNKDKKI